MTALVLAPLALTALALRPGWRVSVLERLGSLQPQEPGAIWIHAASVGEVLAAAGLVERLNRGDRRVFASTTTPTGREVLGRVLPEVPGCLAPVDHPWCVERALARVQPRLLVLVETELWPSWIGAAKRRGIPVVVVSGRLSDRSFPHYRRIRWLLRRTLRRIDAVGARSKLDAERFAALGVPAERISVTGDLKLEAPEGGAGLPLDLARALGEQPLFVAGSTHSGEERAALDALAACEAVGLGAALVVAPRHPNRVAAVEREVRATGRSVRRRSALGVEPLAAGEVLILDTLGELAAVYRFARISFVGGTLAGVGGHNLIEPVLAGCPVLHGPHVANVRTAAEILADSGAGVAVENSEELASALVCELRDPHGGRERVARARAALEAHRGSVARTAELIDRFGAQRGSS